MPTQDVIVSQVEVSPLDLPALRSLVRELYLSSNPAESVVNGKRDIARILSAAWLLESGRPAITRIDTISDQVVHFGQAFADRITILRSPMYGLSLFSTDGDQIFPDSLVNRLIAGFSAIVSAYKARQVPGDRIGPLSVVIEPVLSWGIRVLVEAIVVAPPPPE